MASELDKRLATYRAERDLNRWLAQHGPLLSREADSPETQGMLVNLLRIADAMKIQLHALNELLVEETWAERLEPLSDED